MKFFIQRMGPDSEHLPAAHTCFNILDLPVSPCLPLPSSPNCVTTWVLQQEYSNEEKLREKLTRALTYAQGFGLV